MLLRAAVWANSCQDLGYVAECIQHSVSLLCDDRKVESYILTQGKIKVSSAQDKLAQLDFFAGSLKRGLKTYHTPLYLQVMGLPLPF